MGAWQLVSGISASSGTEQSNWTNSQSARITLLQLPEFAVDEGKRTQLHQTAITDLSNLNTECFGSRCGGKYSDTAATRIGL